MPLEMFCPDCKSLLPAPKKGKARRCIECGYVEGGEAKGQAKTGGEFPLFPYERVRPVQLDFMRDVKAAAKDGKVLLAQAPTGLGKTAATLAVLVEVAREKKKKLLFLTAKQSQHLIVIETLRAMERTSGTKIKVVDIIAKRNMCPENTGDLPGYAFAAFCRMKRKSHSCDLFENDADRAKAAILSRIMHVGELSKVCARMRVCPFKAALEAFGEADVLVCDYNYVFDVMVDTLLEKIEGGLEDVIFVVDEAHNLPDRIRSNLSKLVNSFTFKEVIAEVGSKGLRGQRYTSGLRKAIESWSKRLPEDSEEYVEKQRLTGALDGVMSEVLGEKDSLEDFVNWLEEVGMKAMEEGAEYSHALELSDFLRTWAGSGEESAKILAREAGDKWALNLSHLDPSTMGTPIFDDVQAAILMSGTLFPPEMYADVLGITNEKRVPKVYGSPFPPENRKVLAVKGLTSEYRRRGDAMYDSYAKTLAALTEVVKGNTAVFFPSYKYMEDVETRLEELIEPQRIIMEAKSMTKGDREEVIERLKARKRPHILMAVQGGSLGEGIDYEGNLLSVLVVAGVPLPPPNLEVKALREHYVKRFGKDKGEIYGYYAPAFNKVIQSAGRLIRSETDRGVVVLMDERFFQQRYASYLPPEMKPKVVGSSAELVEEVREFFG